MTKFRRSNQQFSAPWVGRFSPEYLDYMASPEWQQRRRRALTRAGYQCGMAGDGACRGPLDVHHKHYKNLGNEGDEDLQVLCRLHHRYADARRKGDWVAAGKLWLELHFS